MRSQFSVHDFSVSRITDIDVFGNSDDGEAIELPFMELDLWFAIDSDVEFGRVFSLIPNVSADLKTVGIRLKYCVKDAVKLKSEYCSLFPPKKANNPQKLLSYFLTLPGKMARHFGLTYFALEKAGDDIVTSPIEPEEGKRVLASLLRIDFVDAQRNIDDQEIASSNRLSTAFAAFYKKNLEQVEVSEDANRIIDENNEKLTSHYDQYFTELMDVIRNLGVPSVNDRSLKIVSSLNPEAVLKGNTSLLYVDPAHKHELPESYNGLGFKNLIYIAIQISHFHLQWIRTEEKRPLCQIIFIEEPEVHLHAQVQQTFIANIWRIVKEASLKAKEEHMVPQLVLTTHSSHILNAVDFAKVRYFKRCALAGGTEKKVKGMNATSVLNLRDFRPSKESAGVNVESDEETLNFLKSYLHLTHCDLFFTDAAILVEGAVEKLLLPTMIDKSAPNLRMNYLSVLEVGGAHAHRFDALLNHLGVPYLVVADMDSVDPANNRKTCRADKENAETSNGAIKYFLQKSNVNDLVALNSHDPRCSTSPRRSRTKWIGASGPSC